MLPRASTIFSAASVEAALPLDRDLVAIDGDVQPFGRQPVLVQFLFSSSAVAAFASLAPNSFSDFLDEVEASPFFFLVR